MLTEMQELAYAYNGFQIVPFVMILENLTAHGGQGLIAVHPDGHETFLTNQTTLAYACALYEKGCHVIVNMWEDAE